tara:strand:+ start:386 stop:616 length:231 start_codon:yes stop_codon:yes gene_type:complete
VSTVKDRSARAQDYNCGGPVDFEASRQPQVSITHLRITHAEAFYETHHLGIVYIFICAGNNTVETNPRRILAVDSG